jgi:hypothetical protein
MNRIYPPSLGSFGGRWASIKVADTPACGYPVVAGKRIFVEDKNSVMLWTLE